LLMSVVWCNVRPSPHGGGPTIWSFRMTNELQKRGHKVIFEKPQRSDFALCVINTEKVLSQVNRSKTKVILRIDGIYNRIYNQKFNRAIRPDMVSLHNDLKRDIPLVDHVVYQSQWSKDRIDDEIVIRNSDYSIIHNGVDTNLFRPIKKSNEVFSLMHVGRMRDAYLMEMLIGTYLEVKRRGRKTKLILVGGMDAGCSKVYGQYKNDPGIIHLGAFPNHQLAQAYGKGHIFLDVRCGASCNQVVPESQACGLPVITPSWGGSCEMVVHKKTGMIVESGMWDYDQKYISNLSDGVEYAMDNYTIMSNEARRHACQNLNLDIMTSRYLKAMGVR
jgi:glycosyltransferase involved in cell wall biosynthesis